jgi:uncharacterized protein YfiM (DUF2279 family)
MKKTTVLKTIIAMTVAFGLSACTDAEVASMKQDIDDANRQAQGGPKGSVYSPEQGILCDRQAGFCTDSTGISLGFTKEYLGQKNQDTWTQRMQGDFDTTRFSFSNGVYCDTNARTCWTNKYKDGIDNYYTRKLF